MSRVVPATGETIAAGRWPSKYLNGNVEREYEGNGELKFT